MSARNDQQLRVVVPGGSGFIGRAVVSVLAEHGHNVHAVGIGAASDLPPSVTFHDVDLLSPEARRAALTDIGAQAMVHLAWFVKPGQVWNSLENLRWLEASLGIMRDFADAGGERAVVAGTCSEYGPESGLCHEDTTPLAPSNLYGVCKDALRRATLAAAPHLDLSVAWARIFMAYGPGEHPVRLVPSVINHLLRGEPAATSHGRQVRDYLSTDEIAEALVTVLESDFEGAVNVGSGRPVSLREVIDTIAARIGRPDLIRYGEVTPPPDDPPFQVADTTRLNEVIGWRSTLSLESGLERTIEWWHEQVEGA